MDNLKSKKQEEFWLKMLGKYEQRNHQLEEQQCDLQHRLETMESCMPAALLSHMNKAGNGQQVNMVQFMSHLSKSGTTFTNTASISNGCTSNPCTSKKPQDLICEDSASSSTDSVCKSHPYFAQQEGLLDQITRFSLEPSDLIFMGKLQDLVTQEMLMKRQIKEMEHKEQAYMDALKRADQMWAYQEGGTKLQVSNAQKHDDSLQMKYEKMAESLMEENSRLTEELNDTTSELKQYTERLKGSVYLQLEEEKCKAKKLESDIQKIAKREGTFMKKLGDKQNELNCTCGKLCQLTAANEQLRQKLCSLQYKYNELQQDLVNQQISRAHTWQMLNDAGIRDNKYECFKPDNDHKNDNIKTSHVDTENMENANVDSTNVENTDVDSKNVENTNVDSENIENTNVDSENIQDTNVDSINIENTNVDSENIENTNVDSENIQDTNVDSKSIENKNVDSENIENANVDSENKNIDDENNNVDNEDSNEA